MSIVAATVICLLLAQEVETPVGAGPAPAAIALSWELDFQFVDPRRISVGGETYWYMVYTVANTSDRTQRFFPTFQLVTDELQVLDTDMGISPSVFGAIREQHKLTHPDLVSPREAIGDLRSGSDNARQSAAIWRENDVKVNNFTIYVAGLSGETRIVGNPKKGARRPASGVGNAEAPARPATMPEGDNPKHFVLRKTLEIRYTLAGSQDALLAAEPQRKSVRWVMR